MAARVIRQTFLFTNRLSVYTKENCVIFTSPVDEEYYIKRVAAGPGETVIYNGYEITMGEDEYFVLGDNKSNSRDSRSFGPIMRDSLVSVMIL